ncbi:hypothetical protein LPJ79_004552 [Coemansia sp. RSA 1821]|nr:hypothetical protein LPJ79_004552 [Coemansia sp. RSA 1821]
MDFLILIALLASIAQCLEINLEWDIGEGTTAITSASSLLRFTSDAAPEFTEWIPLGWDHGSMSLQHRDNGTAFIVMQLTPPSAHHQAILGKSSDIAQSNAHGTAQGPPQVLLEAPMDLQSSEPYYFKVEAHHDIKQNRTTYEGLYSSGDHWQYLGSLIMQYPTTNTTQSQLHSTSTDNNDLNRLISALATSIPPSTSTSAQSSDSDSDDSGSDENDLDDKQFYAKDDSSEDNSSNSINRIKNPIEFPTTPAFPRIFSGIRRLDGGDPELLRAGVYKSFEMRDRLGDTFFVSKAHAYLYDSSDSDLASVRHYFMASSYLLTIDGPH